MSFSIWCYSMWDYMGVWWWIVLAEWMTDEDRLTIFLSGTIMVIVRDSHHCNFGLAGSRFWTCAETEFRLCRMKSCSSVNHYTTTLQSHGFRFVIIWCLCNSMKRSIMLYCCLRPHLLSFSVIIPMVLHVTMFTNCRLVLLIWMVVLDSDGALFFFIVNPLFSILF